MPSWNTQHKSIEWATRQTNMSPCKGSWVVYHLNLLFKCTWGSCWDPFDLISAPSWRPHVGLFGTAICDHVINYPEKATPQRPSCHGVSFSPSGSPGQFLVQAFFTGSQLSTFVDNPHTLFVDLVWVSIKFVTHGIWITEIVMTTCLKLTTLIRKKSIRSPSCGLNCPRPGQHSNKSNKCEVLGLILALCCQENFPLFSMPFSRGIHVEKNCAQWLVAWH